MTSFSFKNELYVFLNHKKERKIVEFKRVQIFWGKNMKLNERRFEGICVSNIKLGLTRRHWAILYENIKSADCLN